MAQKSCSTTKRKQYCRTPRGASGVGPGSSDRRCIDRKWRVDTSGGDRGRADGNPKRIARGEQMLTASGTDGGEQRGLEAATLDLMRF